jgi:hypothetical protein
MRITKKVGKWRFVYAATEWDKGSAIALLPAAGLLAHVVERVEYKPGRGCYTDRAGMLQLAVRFWRWEWQVEIGRQLKLREGEWNEEDENENENEE